MGSSKGFTIAEQGHVVQLIAPQSASTALTSEVFSMENWGHATIIVHGGAGSSLTVTVSEADNFTPSNQATIVFNYAQEATAAGDTLTALAAATTAGIAIGTATGTYLVIEIDGDELNDGFPNLIINLSDPGTAKIVSAIAILSGGRYQKDITATAIV
ncbi:hypothetical protein LCGC14_1136520 [marine sediment metagenome]|uniref:Uncharacterized protein n=1 Tax=marine sediment metagenome TaxID=412755 RepID=A0A0F9LZN1_9ZZZZ